MPRPLVQKKTWRGSLPIDMLLSAMSVLVVAQSSSEIPEGLMNNSVYFMSITLPINHAFYEIMRKNAVESDRPQMTM